VPPIIDVRNLVKHFESRRWRLLHPRDRDKVRAVNGVTFHVDEGEVLCLAGESGSGKTTIGRCILKLEEPTRGEIYFRGGRITALSHSDFLPLRAEIQAVFQDPFTSLNPRWTIAAIVEEPLLLLTSLSSKERKKEIVRALAEVSIDEDFLGRFPHQLSGGERQRVNIARALVSRPRFLVLDEPVSALDASVRAEVIGMLTRLRQRFALSYLLISHDLNMVRALCDRVAIMRGGRIVEIGRTHQIFESPLHPYTRLLLSSILVPDPLARRSELPSVEGLGQTRPSERITGDYDRRVTFDARDDDGYLPLIDVGGGHYVASGGV